MFFSEKLSTFLNLSTPFQPAISQQIAQHVIELWYTRRDALITMSFIEYVSQGKRKAAFHYRSAWCGLRRWRLHAYYILKSWR